MIGRSDEEMWDKYVEEYAKENEQMEKKQREIAEAADAYMNGVIEDVRIVTGYKPKAFSATLQEIDAAIPNRPL